MPANVPWSVNAVEPDTWATAREAARRSGLSVGEWLEAAIRGSADEHGISRASNYPHAGGDRLQHQLNDISERLDHLTRAQPSHVHDRASDERTGSKLLHSIDALTDRIDVLIDDLRTNNQVDRYQIKTAINRLDSRMESLFSQGHSTASSREPEIEHKLSDIAHEIEMTSQRIEHENARYTAPKRKLSSAELDAAIAEITAVRNAALDEGGRSDDLDRKLAAIDARFGFAPRSDPQLVGLENQIRILTDQMQALRNDAIHSDSIEELRHEIGDLAHTFVDLMPRHSIEALERTVTNLAKRIDRIAFAETHENISELVNALQEIRATLTEVKPAESFSAVEHNLQSLSDKLDKLNENSLDNATIDRLQLQTSEIRDLLSNALPGDTLNTLVGQIETLMQRLEQSPSPNEGAILDVVQSLERRIDAIAERIEPATQQQSPSPALDEIKMRLEQIEHALNSDDHRTPGRLEITMNSLVNKLDAAEERLSGLSTLEKGLSDLVGQMHEVRASAMEIAKRAMRASEREAPVPERSIEIHDLRATAQRDQGMLNLTREESPRLQPAQPPRIPVLRAEPRSIASDPETASVTSARDEGDYPLEPGSGSPRNKLKQSASERVAISEAALDGLTKPQDHPTLTTDFIAAARRAAQTAGKQSASSEKPKANSNNSGLRMFNRNKKALMFGFLLIAITFGAVRFGGLATVIPFLHSEKSVPVIIPAPPKLENVIPENATPEESAPDEQSAVPSIEDLIVASNEAPEMVPPNVTTSLIAKPELEPTVTGSVKDSNSTNAPAQNASIVSRPAASMPIGDLPTAIGTPALRSSALAGDPIAAYEIGSRYFEGRGVPTNYTEAKRWFEIAQANGSVPAAYRLGAIFEKGTGSAKNLMEARRYYTLAAEGGNAKAMHNLAVLYSEGIEGKPDYKMAAQWFRMAADRNVKDSQYNLGVLYARGSGVEVNLAESFRWFSLAASQGDTDAAKKRDDVGKHLDQQTLVAARLAVQTWNAISLDEQVNEPQLKADWLKAEVPTPRKRAVKQ